MSVTLDRAAIDRMTAHGGVVDDGMRALATKIERQAKTLAPVATGRLRESIHTERRSDGWYVVADTPYAVMVHEGTSPHEITPVAARVLRFPTKGGRVVYTQRVDHPGTAPNRFLTRAMRAVVN